MRRCWPRGCPRRAGRDAGRRRTCKGLRDKIDHIIVIFQENRSFDHYFGAYQPPGGGAVAGLLDQAGQFDPRFTGLQKNAAGVPTAICRCPFRFPAFQMRCWKTGRFTWLPTSRPGDNVPWDPMHHFFRMSAQIDNGAMDRFVRWRSAGKHVLRRKGAGDRSR